MAIEAIKAVLGALSSKAEEADLMEAASVKQDHPIDWHQLKFVRHLLREVK